MTRTFSTKELPPLTGFAEACYDMNSPQELVEALAQPKADESDCKRWVITPNEWRAALALALGHQLNDLVESQCDDCVATLKQP